MTGYADQRERAHGLDALVHDVIAKPFSLDQIKGAVREALVRSGTSARNVSDIQKSFSSRSM